MNPPMDDSATTITTPPEPRDEVHPLAHPSPPPPRARRRPGRAILLALLVGLIGFGGGIGGYFAADRWLDDTPTQSDGSATFAQPSNTNDGSGSSDSNSDSSTTPASDAPDDQLTPGTIYSRVSPAVVHIESRTTTTSSGFFGIPEQQEEVGTGSGFVIDTDGHIVTNAHVVDGSQKLTVSFGDDITVDAKLVGEDTSTDIAVIKVDTSDKQLKGTLRTVGFGDSGAVKVGDPVVAIGNPFSLDRTLTTGVVSALQRDIPALNQDYEISDVIQTDAAVNPGNSGGPLLNMAGKVIGVNSQIQTKNNGGFVGIAFAIPSSTVQDIAQQLIDDGKVQHAWLGLAGGELTPELADALDLSVKAGVLVGEVTKGSPADKAGLEGGSSDMVIEGTGVHPGGDVITKFDGKSVKTMRELAAIVDGKKPGAKVKVEYLQNGKHKTATVDLGTRPQGASKDSSGQ
ncbi:MAG: degP [Thermoleophilia bacterium]|nr:degP [Thermoleophilia bacterium]